MKPREATPLVVYDAHGLVHAVYNQRVCQEQLNAKNYVENWQVRTFCAPRNALAVLGGMILQARFARRMDGVGVTCLLCAAGSCDHGIVYRPQHARGLSTSDIRRVFPRLNGECRLGCGYVGIYYASFEHYVAGGW